MRALTEIQRDVTVLKQAIREAYHDEDEREAELLSNDLDEVLEELYEAQRVLILR